MRVGGRAALPRPVSRYPRADLCANHRARYDASACCRQPQNIFGLPENATTNEPRARLSARSIQRKRSAPGDRDAAMIDRLMRRPAATVIGACAALFVVYEIAVLIFAYSGDAYVISDVVALSAEVEGAVSQLSVRDNDTVAKDAPLFTIDPTPYRLQVEENGA